MSLLKKLAGETAMYGLSSILGRFLNYLMVPLYTRTLTQAENGVITELFAYAAFLMVLLSYRLESAFFRYGTDTNERDRAFSTAMGSLLVTTAAITLTVLLFEQPIADALAYHQHPEYIRWLTLILAIDCLTEIPFARLRLEQRPRRFVAIKLVNIGTLIALNLFWLVFCPWADAQGHTWVRAVWSPEVRVGYVFISNLAASAVALLLLTPQLRAASRALFDAALWKKMILYAAPLILVHFAGIVNSMFDRALQKWLLPGTPEENLAAVGVYGNLYKLAMLITILTQAYRYAAEPFFFRHAADADAPALQARVTKWFTIVSAAGMLGVVLYLPWLQYLLGKSFRVDLHLVPILLLANVLLGVYYNFSVWYRLRDRTGLGAVVALGGALITVVLNVALVPVMGYAGSAWAALACYFFLCFATWITGRTHYPVPYPLGRMALYLLLVVGLCVLSYAVDSVLPSSWAQFGVHTVLMLAYPAAVFALEKDELKRLV
jgi:O-antigen/teichoic acid export membrane protein